MDVKDTVNLSTLSKDFIGKIFASNSTISSKTNFWKLQLKKLKIEYEKNAYPEYTNLNSLEFREKVIEGYIFLRCIKNLEIAEKYMKIGNLEKVKERVKKALEITKKIADDHYKTNIFSVIAITLVKVYIKTEELKKALEIAEKIPSYPSKSEVLASIAEAYIK